MEIKMKLKYYTKRGKQAKEYKVTSDGIQIKRTNTGWFISHPFKSGQCDRQGDPYIFEIFKIQDVDYPHYFGEYLEFLWKHSEKKNEEWLQKQLNRLSRWLYNVEITSPKNDQRWFKENHTYKPMGIWKTCK